jgi:hypothetical protein
MKTFHKAVLPWAARFNVDGLDVILGQPLLHNLGDKLRTVAPRDAYKVTSVFWASRKNLVTETTFTKRITTHKECDSWRT